MNNSGCLTSIRMMEIIQWRTILALVIILPKIDAACTFPTELRGEWISSEKGFLTFAEDSVSNYVMDLTVVLQDHAMTFFCEENVGNKYVLKSSTTFEAFNTNFFAYLCLDLTKISDYKYVYYHGTNRETSNNEFMISGHQFAPSLTTTDACVRAEPYDTATFIVLVQKASLADGLGSITCPDDFLATYSNTTITNSDASVSCMSNATGCTDTTKIIYNYDTTCDTSLKYSDSGVFTCLYQEANETAGINYLHVLNNDTSPDGVNTHLVVCYAYEKAGDHVQASHIPGMCETSQTTTSVSSPGLVVLYEGVTQICVPVVIPGPDGTYITTLILALVAGAILLLLLVLLIWKTRCRCLRPLLDKCRNIKVHSESSLSLESRAGSTTSTEKLFIARKPIKIGPIIEPYMEPPEKVEPLYDIDARPSSSRLVFFTSSFFSQLNLRLREMDM